MSTRTVAFVQSLADRFPGLGAILDEHVKDFDEILPHLFFGDLTRYVVNLFIAGRDTDGKPTELELREILSHLEKAYASGDDELQELISVSFLEHLPRDGEDGSKIRGIVGPSLSKQLKVIG